MALERCRFVGLACAALLAVGCSDGATPAAAQPGAGQEEPTPQGQDEVRPLCPTCTALGGETGDFTGGEQPVQTCPSYTELPAEAGLVLPSGLTPAAATLLVQREVALPAVWRDIDRSGYSERLSGFSEQTVLSARIEVTGVSRLEVREDPQWMPDAVAEAACDGLVLSVKVTVATDDGAIVGVFETGRAQVYSDTEAVIRASADIKEFSGRLQLNRPAGARIVERLELYLSSRGERGRMLTETVSAFGEPSDEGWSDPFLELRAAADDGCDANLFPYSGEEAAARTDDILSALALTSPYSARYGYSSVRVFSLDGGVSESNTAWDSLQGSDAGTPSRDTQVTAEFGAASAVCQGREVINGRERSSRQHVRFALPVRLRTADGRHDVSADLSFSALRDGAGAFGTRVSGWLDTGSLPVAELRDRFGIDVTGSGAECASLDLYYPLTSDKRVSVWGGSCDPQARDDWTNVLELEGNP